MRTERRGGWTSDATGEVMGVDGSTILNWERGVHLPSRQHFDKLVGLFPNLAGTIEPYIRPYIRTQEAPGGAPVARGGGVKKGQRISPPAHPPIRPPADGTHTDSDGGATDNGNGEEDLVTITLRSSTLKRVAGVLAADARHRAELIEGLRAAGKSDSFILDIIHQALAESS